MINLTIPKVFEPLFKPKRYKVLSGGRGSSKSESVARWLLACCIQGHERILCTRELQNSIKDSVIKTLSDIIDSEKLSGFEVYNTSIKYPRTRSEFIFSGLHGNIDEIKSLKGITKAWAEESHSISKESLDILIPTIRVENSEIIFTFNRMLQEDPVWLMFCKNYDPEKSSDVWHIHTTFADNPFFPDVLEQERLRCLANSNADYDHIWLGLPKTKVGNIWNTAWFRWEPVEIPEKEFEYRYIVADTAYKERELTKNDKLTDPDYQAFGYWGVLKKKLYLLDVIFKQLKAVEVEAWCLPWILPKVAFWGFRYVWVEDKGHGIYLNQLFPKLKIPIPPEEQLKEWMKTRRLDKVARATNSAARIDINNSNVIINTNMGTEKIARIKEQLALFPNMAHDDLEDLVTDGIYLGLDTYDAVADYKQLLGRK
jgi:phage terminase large subunit-like protein